MNMDNFNFLSELVKSQSGLILSTDKKYLLESRLTPVTRAHNLGDLDSLITTLRTSRDSELVRDVTEAMTTNESFFFRDIKPFETFRMVILPQLLEARAAQKRFRIWCAAASSGQEPYSLAMILEEEAAKLNGWTHEIVATDISRQILARAQSGVYTQFEVQRGLPVQLLAKYFTQVDNGWEITPEIRRMVAFRQHNLLHDLTPLGRFDVVFCRNVLIYFDNETRADIISKIGHMMPVDGVLFLGAAETVVGISEVFRPLAGQRGVYCPSERTVAAPIVPTSQEWSKPCLSIPG